MDPHSHTTTSSTRPAACDARLWPLLLVTLLATLAAALHQTSGTLLLQRLASDRLSFISLPQQPPYDPSTPIPSPQQPPIGDDQAPSAALAARWSTTILVLVACVNAISITFYTLKASTWGRKTLIILGLVSVSLFELVYFIIASASFDDSDHQSIIYTSSRGSGSLFGISRDFLVLLAAEACAAALGSYSLVQTTGYLNLFDISTSKTRARQLNYFVATILLGGTFGYLIVSEAIPWFVGGTARKTVTDATTSSSQAQDTLQIVFLLSFGSYVLALICAILFLKETVQVPEEGSEEMRALIERNKSSTFSLASFLEYLTTSWHRLREVALYHPPALPAKHRLPILKIIIILNIVSDVTSANSFLQLLIDWKFHWGSVENGKFSTIVCGSKLVALVVIVPAAYDLVRKILARRLAYRRSSGREGLLPEEERPLLGNSSAGGEGSSFSIASRNDPSKKLSPWQNPSPWVAFFSFLALAAGWSIMGLGIHLVVPSMVIWGTIAVSLGIGGGPAIHSYAAEVLSHGDEEEEEEEDEDPHADRTRTAISRSPERRLDPSSSTPATSSSSVPSPITQRKLESYVAAMSLLDNTIGILAPLLNGFVYTSTLSKAPWAICIWTASQYFVCAVIIASL